MKLKSLTILSTYSLFIFINSGCKHTENSTQKQNFIYKKTHHGIMNLKNENELTGKTHSEISKIFGASSLKCSFDKSCEYYISSSAEHFYFKTPSKTEHIIYKICFNPINSKVKSVEIIKGESLKTLQNHKFGKSLKNQESLSKGEIFKQIFESSDIKMK